MGVLIVLGCLFMAFGLPLAIFIRVVARDPLRVILFVLGAFFWLLSLLVAALLWFAVVPLREYLTFALAFAVLIQEALRCFFFYLLKRAEVGLEKVSSDGLKIAGVHSIKEARHTTAMVCGLGFGVMSGLFALVNVVADSSGPGVPGLPPTAQKLTPDYCFVVYSSVCVAAMIMFNTLWNVLSWHSLHQLYEKYTKTACAQLALVVVSHYASLMNGYQLYYVFIPLQYVTLLSTAVWVYVVIGGSTRTLYEGVLTNSEPPVPSTADNSARADTHVVSGVDNVATTVSRSPAVQRDLTAPVAT